MPIIQERQTMQDLRAAGFTQQQAEVLAEKFEATVQDIKAFFVAELDKRFALVDQSFAEQEAKLQRALRMQMTGILAAFVGLLGLAVAIIKLFPNVH
jgi:uncharacterized membrane protein YqjE